jgi:hypothetical protein
MSAKIKKKADDQKWIHLWTPGQLNLIELEEQSARAATLLFYWSVIRVVGEDIYSRPS